MKDYLRETIDMMNKAYISGATATDAYSKAQASIIEKLKAQVEKLQKRNEWLEEVVGLAVEFDHIHLDEEGWPKWIGDEEE